MYLEREEVLDHGYIELIDVMGSDKAIVEAARQSVAGEDVKTPSEDRTLIRYLMRRWHTSPFEMAELKFRVKMPIFVARQWVRHRTANLNEMSARYSVLPEEYYVPREEDIQPQSTNNKQGRSGELCPGKVHTARCHHQEGQEEAFGRYKEMIADNVARETARTVLPMGTYTEMYWKLDLHNIFHFLRLRMDPHAQMEIRVYAEAMGRMVAKHYPAAWEAFIDYRMESMQLTRLDVKAIQQINSGAPAASVANKVFDNKRERAEFLSKWEVLSAEV